MPLELGLQLLMIKKHIKMISIAQSYETAQDQNVYGKADRWNDICTTPYYYICPDKGIIKSMTDVLIVK